MAAPTSTTIALDRDTRDRLRSLKRGQESYDELLRRLIKLHENTTPQ